MIQHWQRYEKTALDCIRKALAAQPDRFHLSKEAGARLSQLEVLPFGCLQFVFYAEQEWLLLFLKNELNPGEPYGISVDFCGETFTGVCDLSEAEAVEEDA